MRVPAPLLALATLPLAACGQGEEQAGTPVMESEAAPVGTAEDTELAPSTPSPADPSTGSVTAPAGQGSPATPSPSQVGDAEEVGEQYQDFVGEQPAGTQ